MKKEIYVLCQTNNMEPRFLLLTKGEAKLVEDVLDYVSADVDFDKLSNYDIFEVIEKKEN